MGGWGIGKEGGGSLVSWYDKKKNEIEKFSKRMEGVMIECDDAISCIKRWDSPKTWFYIDPPYIGSNMGHYSSYTESDFIELLELLCSIKGKFMLSMYEHEKMISIAKSLNWTIRTKTLKTTTDRARSEKTEYMIYNYSDLEGTLFP
jgi:DNA adenine methylase